MTEIETPTDLERLPEYLERHRRWAAGEDGGRRLKMLNCNLTGADFSGLDLHRADFTSSDLSAANLSGANLRGADLRHACLVFANLQGADLRGANPDGANLTGCQLSGAKVEGATWGDLVDVPVLPSIHEAVFAVASEPGALNMSAWHTCMTTHCRAGWVTTLAGPAGQELDDFMGTDAAAALIYAKSDPFLATIPDWYTNNDEALADMERRAVAEAAS